MLSPTASANIHIKDSSFSNLLNGSSSDAILIDPIVLACNERAINMTQIKLHYAVLLLYWVGRPFGAAMPIDQIQKRGPVDCFPVVPPDTPFYWWDCANAVLEINGKSPNSNNVPYVFGSDLGATHTNDVYSWTSGSIIPYLSCAERIAIRRKLTKYLGTCIIEMAAESSVNQVATWNSIKTAALRIVNTCVKGQSQLGGTYVREWSPCGHDLCKQSLLTL